MKKEVGHWLGMGIMQGLDGTNGAIQDSASNIADGIQGQFNGIQLPTLTPSDMLTGNFGMMDMSGSYTSSMNIKESDTDGMAQKIFDSVYNAMTKAMSNPENSQDVILQVGSTEFGRVAITSINKITKQEGKLGLNI